jgi:4-diphosphocytidyl-2-C-methyl-D-erythritol kinase
VSGNWVWVVKYLNNKTLLWPAPAKLNLFLHVLGRRDDGYHEIQTLFQLIDFCDQLQFEILENPDISRPQGNYDVDEQDDLVVKAAKLLQSRTDCRSGAIITVKKNIPLGSGLGGGSSDAATTLLALNVLWECGLSQSDLASLGAELGADVPVFVQGRSAMATGIGENLQFEKLGDRHYVLVFSSLRISTEAIFNHPDLSRKSDYISRTLAVENGGVNDCESVVCTLYPEVETRLNELKKWGQARMTGTGSCIFLPMNDKKAAIEAADEIKCRYNVRAVHGIDKSPVHEMLGNSFPNV